MLAHRNGCLVEVGHARNFIHAQVLHHRDDVLDRSLDMSAVAGGTVKVLRRENRRQQRFDLVIAVAQDRAQLVFQVLRQVVAHKVAIDLSCQIVCRDRLLEDDLQGVDAVEVAGLAQERLRTIIMLVRVDLEREIVEVPAGERPRAFADVLLRVVPHAHGEELHHLTGKVLVGGALHVVLGVEEIQHRRVLGDLDGQIPDAAGRALFEQLDLLQHLAVVANLVLVRGKVAVPHQGHLFLQRMRGLQHPVRPPVAKAARFEHRRAEPVEEAV